jgi:hypothetical protein
VSARGFLSCGGPFEGAEAFGQARGTGLPQESFSMKLVDKLGDLRAGEAFSRGAYTTSLWAFYAFFMDGLLE